MSLDTNSHRNLAVAGFAQQAVEHACSELCVSPGRRYSYHFKLRAVDGQANRQNIIDIIPNVSIDDYFLPHLCSLLRWNTSRLRICKKTDEQHAGKSQ